MLREKKTRNILFYSTVRRFLGENICMIQRFLTYTFKCQIKDRENLTIWRALK